MTTGRRTFAIDYLPESLERYGPEYSIVAIDVFRATTTVVTSTSLGRKCIPAPAIEEAVALASRLPDALLAGELGGTVPYGFQLDNSSVLLVGRDDVERPLILISTSGTRVLSGALPGQTVYAACLRNVTAQADHLVRHEPRVALIAAGARGEFRHEDALCCARLGRLLLEAGFEPENRATEDVIREWADASTDAIAQGPSADFLRNTGRDSDIHFVLNHVDDVDGHVEMHNGVLEFVKGT
jgi:2-phosphosulfolactate phosphatase